MHKGRLDIAVLNFLPIFEKFLKIIWQLIFEGILGRGWGEIVS